MSLEQQLQDFRLFWVKTENFFYNNDQIEMNAEKVTVNTRSFSWETRNKQEFILV